MQGEEYMVAIIKLGGVKYSKYSCNFHQLSILSAAIQFDFSSVNIGLW
jgi:hypothetical protein